MMKLKNKRLNILFIVFVLFFIAVLVSSNTVFGANIYFNGTAAPGGAGTIANHFNNISAGLTNANPNDIIIIDNGTYIGTSNTGLTITKSVNIMGAKYADPSSGKGDTILDAESLRRIFSINSGIKVNINGIIFQNGYGNGMSGGAIISAANLTVNNSTFRNNRIIGLQGGAIAISTGNATTTINNCIFTNNSAGQAGAINHYSGILVVNNSNFTNHTAGQTGAIQSSINSTSTTIINCSFTGNKAIDTEAGAVYGTSGTLNIVDSFFVNNTAIRTAGAIRIGNIATISNTYFYGNRLNGNGSAIFETSASPLTIVNN